MKLSGSTSLSIVLGVTSVVVGYLAYLSSSGLYAAIAAVFLLSALFHKGVVGSVRSRLGRERTRKLGLEIVRGLCILTLITFAVWSPNTYLPILHISILLILSQVALSRSRRLRDLQGLRAEPGEACNAEKPPGVERSS